MENVAFSKKKQKSFQSSVENYKKLLKEGEITIEQDVVPKKSPRERKPHGIVYLSNIPHGFYEDEMREYFSQFGLVSRLRLARSKNSGRSKGYAFIEFKVPEIAQIVAETMNNYLMCKRLLKAHYIPPEKQTKSYFKGKNWTEDNYPKINNRKKNLKRENKKKTDQEVLAAARKQLKGIEKVKKKLLEVGIIYNFQPIDIPKELTRDTSDDPESEEENNSTDNSSNSESESETENIKPTLLLDESDDSDLVFNAPPGYKTLVVSKSKTGKKNTFKPNAKKVAITNKKLTGISKKSNVTKPKVSLDKDSKKMLLIQKNLNGNQVTLKKTKDIKAKRK